MTTITELINKYPKLFKNYVKKGMYLPNGWYNIVNLICEKISELDTKNEIDVFSIRKLNGNLSFIINIEGDINTKDPDHIFTRATKIITTYINLASKTCETCGVTPATSRIVNKQMISLCHDCFCNAEELNGNKIELYDIIPELYFPKFKRENVKS